MSVASKTIDGLIPGRKQSSQIKRRDSSRPVWMEEPGPVMRIAKAIALTVIVIMMTFPIVYVV
ncbi:MAG: hypothetical protein WKF81_07405, partial [Thermomicrobiales bacterium]